MTSQNEKAKKTDVDILKAYKLSKRKENALKQDLTDRVIKIFCGDDDDQLDQLESTDN